MIRNDITKVAADAIVNTANPKPVIGGGTDTAIYEAAGKEDVLKERMKIGNIERGDAAYTRAYRLNAKYIIHTVGPSWTDGGHGEEEILRSCYRKSLELAKKLRCKSIAFPLISTGIYGFPRELALEAAMDEIGKFLLTNEMMVYLVVFDRKSFAISQKRLDDIDEYIDDHYALAQLKAEYAERPAGTVLSNIHERREAARPPYEPYVLWEEEEAEEADLSPAHMEVHSMAPMPGASGRKAKKHTLSELLSRKTDTFQQKLFELIDASGLDDVTVYKRANLDRKLFSTIRKKKDYTPKKKTALALAVALHLDLNTTRDLLARAGLALSPASKGDVIVSYFIENGIYDIYEINITLFDYDQPQIGG